MLSFGMEQILHLVSCQNHLKSENSAQNWCGAINCLSSLWIGPTVFLQGRVGTGANPWGKMSCFKQNSRLCKFYIISGFTASIFRTLSLSFCPENGTWPTVFRKASRRSAEERKFAKLFLHKVPQVFTPKYSYFCYVPFPKQTHMQTGGPDVSFPTFKCTI